MADDQNNAVWPLPTFQFEVDLCGQSISVQEVSGLEETPQVVADRAPNSQVRSIQALPGSAKSNVATLKRAIVASDHPLWDWLAQVELNNINPQTVTIRLLDVSGAPKMSWDLNTAWPSTITGTNLRAESADVAVDCIELVYETLTLRNG